jgi:hypothetical protein
LLASVTAKLALVPAAVLTAAGCWMISGRAGGGGAPGGVAVPTLTAAERELTRPAAFTASTW